MIPAADISCSRPQRLSHTLSTFYLNGPAGRLEAVVNHSSSDARFAALVCHPHPLGGGTLHNKVVYHAMKVLHAPEWGFGWPVLRFNFRGAGLSEGTHDGSLESDDVLAALRWIENEYNRPAIVVGFSFGAAMAFKACCGGASRPPSVRAIAALGLPVGAEGRQYDYSFLKSCAIPKFFLSGDRDSFADRATLAHIAAEAEEPKQLVLVPGADHFFSGRLKQMQGALAAWLKEQLP